MRNTPLSLKVIRVVVIISLFISLLGLLHEYYMGHFYGREYQPLWPIFRALRDSYFPEVYQVVGTAILLPSLILQYMLQGYFAMNEDGRKIGLWKLLLKSLIITLVFSFVTSYLLAITVQGQGYGFMALSFLVVEVIGGVIFSFVVTSILYVVSRIRRNSFTI